LVDPVAPGTPAALSTLGVSTILVHPDVYTSLGLQKPAPTALGPGYRLVGRFPDGTSIWRVTAQPAPAFASFGPGFGPSELTGREPSRWLEAGDGTIEIYARKAGLYRARLRLASYARTRMVSIEGHGRSRSFLVTPGAIRPSFLVRVPAGRST